LDLPVSFRFVKIGFAGFISSLKSEKHVADKSKKIHWYFILYLKKLTLFQTAVTQEIKAVLLFK
jgi:hypothetical protein